MEHTARSNAATKKLDHELHQLDTNFTKIQWHEQKKLVNLLFVRVIRGSKL